MAAPALFLGATSAPINCRVHPVVILTILDNYIRRNDGQDRVIGTLLGVVTEGNVVEIRNCFPVPHLEKGDEVLVDQEFHRTTYQLHQKVNPKEVVVGWYATGREITAHSCLIHDFYGNKEQSLFTPQAPLVNPLHLTVDTALTNNTLGIKAFISTPLVVADKLAMFQEIPTEMYTQDSEKIGLDLLLKSCTENADGSVPSTLSSNIDSLEASIQKLLTMLESCDNYVESVLSGSVKPNAAVGRALADTVAAIARVDPDQFDRMFNNSLQDILMVVYLSNLTRTQIALTEKLNALQ
eukprot:GILK01000901.1.p1 GENE.GILK01000901.1~~GILK01000901.1.p1  ORF type:complete len:311 (+),score=44.01 GILK01000901.1:47-934(+)